MKRIVFALAILLAVSCQQKIGFVDNQELINEYQEKKDIEEKFKKKVDAFTKKRDSLAKAFDLEARAFQNKVSSLSQSKAEEEYALLQQKNQFISQQLQQEEYQLQAESQVEIDSLISKVRKYVKSYGESNGYDFILGANEAGSVLYGKEAQDVTQLLLEELNKEYNK